MKKILALLAFAIAISAAAHAETITYTLSDTASGTLGNTAFTNALVTFTEVGDTQYINASTSGSLQSYYMFTFLQGTLNIAGIGSFVFGNNNDIVVNNNINNGNTFLGMEARVDSSMADPTFYGFEPFVILPTPYDLNSSYGPVVAQVDDPFATYAVPSTHTYTDADFPTPDGPLSISSYGSTATFSAILGDVPPSVPEPSSFVLLGTGVLGLAGSLRRRYLGA